MKRRHRGVLYGGLVAIVVMVTMYALAEYRLNGSQDVVTHITFSAMLCAPFGLGLLVLFVAMPRWLAQVVLGLAGLGCILVMAVVVILLPLGILVYVPMVFVYWHAALTLDSPKGRSGEPSLPS